MFVFYTAYHLFIIPWMLHIILQMRQKSASSVASYFISFRAFQQKFYKLLKTS